MTARRLERRPAGPAVHLPRARRTVRLPAAFWPLLGLNTLLQLAAVLGRPDWLRWGLQLPVAVALVVVVGRYLMRWRVVRWRAVRWRAVRWRAVRWRAVWWRRERPAHRLPV